MNQVDRRSFILQQVESRGSVTVASLADQLQVSEMTIRRDLNDLEKDGLVKRIYGGAVSARGRSYEPPLLLRSKEHAPEKKAIGHRAAQLVADGDSIALDVGTTTLEVARQLQDRRNLTIITPSLHIANLFVNNPHIRLILPGGTVRPGEASMIGDLAQQSFKDLFVDRLFLGVGGIDVEAGITEFNLDDAFVKRAMIQSAKEVIVVADASKFDRVAFAAIAPLSAIHVLITDEPPAHDLAAALEEHGIIVHSASTPDSK